MGVDDGGMMEFMEWDVLRSAVPHAWPGEGFDVVLDKGTFDAVCLSGELDGEGRPACEGWRARVEGLVRRGGLLVVTSCNWTEGELGAWFAGGELEVWGRVEYPVFRFGGGVGQSVVSLVLRRKG